MPLDEPWRWRAHDRPGGAAVPRGPDGASAATAVAAFVLLVVVWELVKLVVPADGVSIGGVRVLPRTSDAAMPHVWTVLGRLFDPEVAGAAQQRSIGAAVALRGAVHAAALARRAPARRRARRAAGRADAAVRPARARAAALRRGVADGAADRDRPARRRLGRQDRGVRPAVAALGERHGDRRLPGVLPDRGRHAARPDLAARRGRRAVPGAGLRLVDDAAAAAAARVGAVPDPGGCGSRPPPR